MGFTYNPTKTTELDQVRRIVGDTDGQQRELLRLEDELITAELATGAGVNAVALKMFDVLLARFAREKDTGIRSAGLEAQRVFERLLLLRRLHVHRMSRAGGPSEKPVLVATREAWEDSETLTQPPARPGFFDADD